MTSEEQKETTNVEPARPNEPEPTIEKLSDDILALLKKYKPVEVDGMDPALHYLAPHVPKVRWTELGDLVAGREKATFGAVDEAWLAPPEKAEAANGGFGSVVFVDPKSATAALAASADDRQALGKMLDPTRSLTLALTRDGKKKSKSRSKSRPRPPGSRGPKFYELKRVTRHGNARETIGRV